MDKKESVVKRLRKFRKKVGREFSVEKMYLFGSFAWGKLHKDSDVDLIIVSKKFSGMNFFERGAKMYNYWTLRLPVDFLCYTPEEFRKLKNQVTIVSEAVKKGIEIN
jgi:uncharacterized protein